MNSVKTLVISYDEQNIRFLTHKAPPITFKAFLSNNKIFDFLKYNFKYEIISGHSLFYYSDLLANDQDVTLDIVTSNNVAKIKLPTLKHPDTSNWMVGKDYDKPEVSNISDSGVYDKKNSTITWNNITEDKQVNFEMKHDFSLEDP